MTIKHITATKELTHAAKKKWDGELTLLKGGFKDMWEANDWINDEIEKGNLPKVESEHREYYVIPEVA